MNEERLAILEMDDRKSVEFHVLKKARINGMNYLLVTDAEEDDEDRDRYILKDMSKAEEAGAVCESMEGDDEMDYLFRIFPELIEDMDIGLKK